MNTLAVLALWRNSESYIHRTLEILNELSKEYSTEFFFYENDSTDNTRQILSNWISDREGIFMYEDIKAPKFGSVSSIDRFILMSYYRNKLKQLATKTTKKISLLIDSDVIFNNKDVNELYNGLFINNAAMCVANTRQPQIPDLVTHKQDGFYDVIAIRDKFGNAGIFFSDCPLVIEEDRQDWINNRPIRIMSGFSGLSTIKTDVLHRCNWSTNNHVEHINFCYEVAKYGPIYIIPNSRPKVEIDPQLITNNIDRWKTIAQQQRQDLSNISQIYSTSLSTNLSFI